MPRRLVHSFNVDFDLLKEGDRFESLCGKRYIADRPPTEEEKKRIHELTQHHLECKKCLKIKNAS